MSRLILRLHRQAPTIEQPRSFEEMGQHTDVRLDSDTLGRALFMMKKNIGTAAKRLLPGSVYSTLCRSYDSPRRLARFVSCLGFGRECPLCHARVRRFLPETGEPSVLFTQLHVIGGGPIEQSVCPFCGSFERERHVFLYLSLATDIFRRPVRMLHVAPERRLERLLANRAGIHYSSGDLNPGRAQLRVDLTSLEFPAETFDVVICNHVLEHIPRDDRAMAEIFRVLRPGGWAMVQVPLVQGIDSREDLSVTSPDERLRLFGQHDHVRLYGTGDFVRRLESADFRVTTDSIGRRFGDGHTRRYGLLPEEMIYIATRPAAPAH